MKCWLHRGDGDRGESKEKAAGLQLSLQNKFKKIIIIVISMGSIILLIILFPTWKVTKSG